LHAIVNKVLKKSVDDGEGCGAKRALGALFLGKSLRTFCRMKACFEERTTLVAGRRGVQIIKDPKRQKKKLHM